MMNFYTLLLPNPLEVFAATTARNIYSEIEEITGYGR